MGLWSDAVEGEHAGHHVGVRGHVAWYGGRFALYVDGRKRDWTHIVLLGRRSMMTVVDGELVTCHVRYSLRGCEYRVFWGDEEVSLHVEAGESSDWIVAARPSVLPAGASGHRTLDAG
jgi:hypothetical protein